MPETNEHIELIWPVPTDSPITAHFGEDFGRGRHRGVDFGVATGTPVYACADGKVVKFTNDGSFGNGVCIDHEGTVWYSLCAHMSSLLVVVGDVVKKGQQIGLSGNTGLSTGPHVHWQLCRSNQFPVDPAQSADPLQFVVANPPPAPPPVAPTLESRVADVESLLGGGANVASQVHEHGNDLWLGFVRLQQAVGELVAGGTNAQSRAAAALKGETP